MKWIRLYVPVLLAPVEIPMSEDEEARKLYEYMNDHGIRADLVTVNENVQLGWPK